MEVAEPGSEPRLPSKSVDFQQQHIPFSPQGKNFAEARCQWLTLVILATWEAKIRRIMV
jgi:hypothetical protein